MNWLFSFFLSRSFDCLTIDLRRKRRRRRRRQPRKFAQFLRIRKRYPFFIHFKGRVRRKRDTDAELKIKKRKTKRGLHFWRSLRRLAPIYSPHLTSDSLSLFLSSSLFLLYFYVGGRKRRGMEKQFLGQSVHDLNYFKTFKEKKIKFENFEEQKFAKIPSRLVSLERIPTSSICVCACKFCSGQTFSLVFIPPTLLPTLVCPSGGFDVVVYQDFFPFLFEKEKERKEEKRDPMCTTSFLGFSLFLSLLHYYYYYVCCCFSMKFGE